MKTVDYNGKTDHFESAVERQQKVEAVAQELFECCKNNRFTLTVRDVEMIADRLKGLAAATVISENHQ